jgi:hypothetical protein
MSFLATQSTIIQIFTQESNISQKQHHSRNIRGTSAIVGLVLYPEAPHFAGFGESGEYGEVPPSGQDVCATRHDGRWCMAWL